MVVLFCILVLIIAVGVRIYDRRTGRTAKPIKRRDLRALRHDIKAWQNGAQPKLRENEE